MPVIIFTVRKASPIESLSKPKFYQKRLSKRSLILPLYSVYHRVQLCNMVH